VGVGWVGFWPSSTSQNIADIIDIATTATPRHDSARSVDIANTIVGHQEHT